MKDQLRIQLISKTVNLPNKNCRTNVRETKNLAAEVLTEMLNCLFILVVHINFNGTENKEGLIQSDTLRVYSQYSNILLSTWK